MDAATTTITVELTPEGETTPTGEAMLAALDERGFKYEQVSRDEYKITYLVWDPEKGSPRRGK